MATYTPLQPNQTASYGTSGDAVRALQTQLNQQNSGQVGYTPIKVDGLYGPLTQAAANYKPAGSGSGSSTPTAGDIYNIPGLQESSDLSNARSSYSDYYSTLANGGDPVDERRIRSQTMDRFQAEIDATNQIYAEKLRQAKLTGRGRVGSGTAIQARRGLLGSDFGGALTDNINTDNNAIYAGVNAEKNAAVQAILGLADKAAAEAIAEKRAAMEKGLDARLKYYEEAGVRKVTNTQKAAQYLVTQGYDPKSIPADVLQKLATSFGVSVEDLTGAYANAKAEKEAADLKALQDGAFNLSEGQARYDANGNLIASRVKTYAPGSGGGSGTSVEAQSWASLISSGRATLANVPSALRSAVSVALAGTPMQSIVRPTQIDALLNNPKFDKAFGPIDQYAPKFGEAALARNQVNQILAQLKLDGRKILKGQGAVSDWEGKTVGEAASTISMNLNEDIARRLLTDLRNTIQKVDESQAAGGGAGGGYDSGQPEQMQLADGTVLTLQPDGTYE